MVVFLCVACVACFGIGYKLAPRINRLRYRVWLSRLSRKFPPRVLRDEPGAWYCQEKPILWAHAGGGSLHIYGNSKEAIADSIEKGFKVIEVDVDLTSDGVPVLSHRFRPDNQVQFDYRPTLSEFLSTPINDKYTPLTLKGLFDEFKYYDGYWAIDSWGLANCGIDFNLPVYLAAIQEGGIKGRVIYLANSLQEGIRVAKSAQFASVHCGLPEDIDKPGGLWQLPYLIRIYTGAGIRSVTLMDRPISEMTKVVLSGLKEMGIYVSVCGVETTDRCGKWINVGANCFNTNYLVPTDLY